MKQYKYHIKGTLRGTRCYETHTETMGSAELLEYLDEIMKLFPRDPEDELATYINESDSKIHGIISEIWVSVKIIDGDLHSWTEVTSSKELTRDEKSALIDYLTGQFSDGYGEGLEQREFIEYMESVPYEEYDEENDEWYEDEYPTNVSCYLNLWNSEDFTLEFVEDSNPAAGESTVKPRCKLIGEDGNIFNLIGIASRTLRKIGMREQADEMRQKAFTASSYEEALSIIMNYVDAY